VTESALPADPAWPAPAVRPLLGRDEVHLWRCWLDQPDDRLEELRAVLSPEERIRADRPYQERGRRHAVVARGFLRRVLAGYAGVAPEVLSFSYGHKGKPSFGVLDEHADLRFNLSHSGELAILAVARERDLGVDVERLRLIPDHADIAARFFSPAENAELEARWSDDPIRGFFTCWTRKEAYIKATGLGLSQPLDGFDVALAPDEPARLLRVERDEGETSRWTFAAFVPAPGYLGAIAVEGAGWTVRAWSFGAQSGSSS
jgi:4'-phosphopantetheinyl transferase